MIFTQTNGGHMHFKEKNTPAAIRFTIKSSAENYSVIFVPRCQSQMDLDKSSGNTCSICTDAYQFIRE